MMSLVKQLLCFLLCAFTGFLLFVVESSYCFLNEMAAVKGLLSIHPCLSYHDIYVFDMQDAEVTSYQCRRFKRQKKET